jgi:hypothetical protein
VDPAGFTDEVAELGAPVADLGHRTRLGLHVEGGHHRLAEGSVKASVVSDYQIGRHAEAGNFVPIDALAAAFGCADLTMRKAVGEFSFSSGFPRALRLIACHTRRMDGQTRRVWLKASVDHVILNCGSSSRSLLRFRYIAVPADTHSMRFRRLCSCVFIGRGKWHSSEYMAV